MVPERQNIVELRADSTGFCGESLLFTKGRIRRRDYLACWMGSCLFGTCKSWFLSRGCRALTRLDAAPHHVPSWQIGSFFTSFSKFGKTTIKPSTVLQGIQMVVA